MLSYQATAEELSRENSRTYWMSYNRTKKHKWNCHTAGFFSNSSRIIVFFEKEILSFSLINYCQWSCISSMIKADFRPVTMGAILSSEKRINAERIKRENLDHQLQKLQHSLHVTAVSHYIASEYYRRLDSKLQYASAFTGAIGSTTSVASKLGWKLMVSSSPRLAPVLVAVSTTSLLFTALVHLPQINNTPGNMYKAHFKSGIECQYLQKQVKFLRKTAVWDASVPWETLANQYSELLLEKKQVNTRIQSEYWSYRKALNEIENRKKEKKRKENEIRKDWCIH